MGILELIATAGQSNNRSTPPKARPRDFKGVDRRKGAGRSEFSCGLNFKTALAVGPIEDWLKDNFPDEYRISLQGMSDDLKTKQIRIAFAMPFQRDAFKEFLQGHRR